MSNNNSGLSKSQMQSLGYKIKKARQEIDFSQKELGDALKLSDKTVSSYEVGRAQPSLKTLQDLSAITHKPINYFLEQTELDLDLQLRIKKIEQELLEVKKMIKTQNS